MEKKYILLHKYFTSYVGKRRFPETDNAGASDLGGTILTFIPDTRIAMSLWENHVSFLH